ncbi:hypothetical protein GWK08_09405 [Leptobacterium flavescens]|uniref:Uncharacterized protein n=1 Tax=Leptobacterium flavescens TaxID=472055 RepID=A0A6P0US06_9FLAO|nr:hypothetical protein [Leptobacterium flavescens]NER13653.1 hypothetical protein [Leptobacterium flavescens]
MPIKSYLAYPVKGKRQELLNVLQNMEECEVVPAENHDVIVVVSETSNGKEEDILQEKLNAIESLQMLSMVSGFETRN